MIKKSTFFFFLILTTLIPFSIATSLSDNSTSSNGEVTLDISPANKLAGMRASIYKRSGGQSEKWIGHISLSNPKLNLPFGTYRLDFPSVSGHKVLLSEGSSHVFTIDSNHRSIAIKGQVVSNTAAARITLKTEGKPSFTEQPTVKLRSKEGQYYPLKFNPHCSTQNALVFEKSHLPEGTFTLHISPHSPMLKKPEVASLQVKQGARIDRSIALNYLEPKVTVSVKNCEDPHPQIIFKQNDQIVKTYSGRQVQVQDLKAGNYLVSVLATDSRGQMPAQEVHLKPGDSNAQIEFNWSTKPATLSVIYSSTLDAQKIASLSPVLTKPSGSRICINPKKNIINQPSQSDQLTIVEYTFENVPPGRYTIRCQGKCPKAVFNTPKPTSVYLSAGQTISKTQTITPYNNSLFVSVQPDKRIRSTFDPTISLYDSNHKLITQQQALSLSCPSLAPGDYTLVFGAVDYYQTPANQKVSIDHNANVQIKQTYSLYSSQVQPIIQTDLPSKYFEKGYINIRSQSSGEIAASWPTSSGQWTKPGSKNQIITFDPIALPADSYEIEFETAHTTPLLPEPQKQVFSIINNQPQTVQTPIFGQFASLSLQVKCDTYADMPIGKDIERQVGFELYRSNKKIFSHSGPQPIKLSKLVPDSYTIAFSPVEGYETPESISLDLDPGEDRSLIKVTYAPQPGSVVLESYLNHDIITAENYFPQLVRIETGDIIQPSSIDPQTLHVGQQALFERVPAGRYRVEFLSALSESALFKPDLIEITVDPAKRTHFHKQLELADAQLEIEATLDYPLFNPDQEIISIKQDKGAINLKGPSSILLKDAPAGHYIVEFTSIDGLIAPKVERFTLLPNQNKKIALHYEVDKAQLDVRLPINVIPNIEQAFVTLTLSHPLLSVEKLQPTTVQVNDQYQVYSFKDIPKGNYTLDVDLGPYNPLFTSDRQIDLALQTNRVINPQLESTRGQISIASYGPNGPLTTEVIIIDQFDEIVYQGHSAQTTVNNLLEGQYTIKTASLDGFDGLEQKLVHLTKNNLSEDVHFEYTYKPSVITVNFIAKVSKEIAQQAPFELCNENDIVIATPTIVHNDDYFSLCYDQLNPGQYTLRCTDASYAQLFNLPKTEEFKISPGQTIEKTIDTSPRWAYLNIDSSLIDGSYPRLALYDAKGHLIYDTKGDSFSPQQLIPGEYTLAYAAIDLFDTPRDQVIELAPNDSITIEQKEYKRLTGSLHIASDEIRRPDLYDQMKLKIEPLQVEKANIDPIYVFIEKESDGVYGCNAFNLPTGRYSITPLPENTEIFAQIKPQEINVYNNETILVELAMPVAWVNTSIQTQLPIGNIAFEDIELEVLDADENVAFSKKGATAECELLPGKYILQTKTANQFKPLPPLHFSVAANQTPSVVSQQLMYKEGSIELNLSLEHPQDALLHQASVVLLSPRSEELIFQLEPIVRQSNQIVLQSSALDYGRYDVIINLPENNFEVTQKHFSITVDSQEPLQIDKIIDLPWAKVAINANFDAPFLERSVKPITIYNDHNEIVHRSVDGSLSKYLVPGEYTVIYGEVAGYFTPEPDLLWLDPSSDKQLSSYYTLMSGSANITYQASDSSNLIDDLDFIISYEGKPIDLSLFDVQLYDNGISRELEIRGLPLGNYSITPLFNNDLGYIENLETLALSIDLDQTSYLNYTLPIHTGSIDMQAYLESYKWSYQPNNSPKIALTKGNETIQSSSNTLFEDRLPYGVYEVTFTDVEGWNTPDKMTLVINNETNAHQQSITYKVDSNDLFIEIALEEGAEHVFNPELVLSSSDGQIQTVINDCRIDTDNEVPCLRWSLLGLPKLEYKATVNLLDPDSIFANCDHCFECSLNEEHAIALKRTFAPKPQAFNITANLPKHFDDESVMVWVKNEAGSVVSSGHNNIDFSMYRGTYLISFEPHPRLNTPQDIILSLNDQDPQRSITGAYTPKKGNLDILVTLEPTIDLPTNLQGKLVDSEGRVQPLLKNAGYSSLSFTASDRFVGSYTFTLEQDDKVIASLPVTIEENKLATYSYLHTIDAGSLEVSIHSLEPLQGSLDLTVQSDDYLIEMPITSQETFQLSPGRYTVYTHETPQYHEINKQSVQVEKDQTTKVTLEPKKRSAVTSFSIDLPDGQKEWIEYVISQGTLELRDRFTGRQLVYPLNSLDRERQTLHLSLPVGQWQASIQCNSSAECLFYSSMIEFDHKQKSQNSMKCEFVLAALTPVMETLPKGSQVMISLSHAKSLTQVQFPVKHLETIFVPAGTYTISFEELTTYITPEQTTLFLDQDSYNSLEIDYQKQMGSATFNIELESDEQYSPSALLILTDPTGDKIALSPEMISSQMIFKAQDIPSNEYSCFIDCPDSLLTDESQLAFKANLTASNAQQFNHYLPICYASAKIELADRETPATLISLKTEKKIADFNQGQLFIEKLIPGVYSIQQGSSFDHTFTAAPNEVVELQLSEHLQTSSLVYTWNLIDNLEIDTNNFSINLSNANYSYKPSSIEVFGSSIEARFDSVYPGTYEISIDTVGMDQPFTPEITQCELSPFQTNYYQSNLDPFYGTLIIDIKDMPEFAQATITVTNNTTQEVFTTEGSSYINNYLPAGQYSVTFSSIDAMNTPDTITFECTPVSSYHSYVTAYDLSVGDLNISLEHPDNRAYPYRQLHLIHNQTKESYTLSLSDSSNTELQLEKLPVGDYKLCLNCFEDHRSPLTLVESIPVETNACQDCNVAFNSLTQPVSVKATWPEELSLESYPQITITDSFQNVIAQQTKSLQTHLLPGKYTIAFSPLKGLQAPFTQELVVEPGIQQDLIGSYEYSLGSIYIDIEDPSSLFLDDLAVSIFDPSGSPLDFNQLMATSIYQESIQNNHKIIELQKLPTGTYNVIIKNNASELESSISKHVTVIPNQEQVVSHTLQQQYAHFDSEIAFEVNPKTHTAFKPQAQQLVSRLEKAFKSPRLTSYPQFTLMNSNGESVASHQGIGLSASYLPLGFYKLHVTPIDRFASKSLSEIDLTYPRALQYPIIYQPSIGDLQIVYSGGDGHELMPALSIRILNEDQLDILIEKDQYQVEHFDDISLLTIANVPVGSYGIEISSKLLSNGLYRISQKFDVVIEENSITKAYFDFTPSWASLDCILMIDDETVHPTVTLQDEDGNTFTSSDEGFISIDKLPPGTWNLVFEEINGYHTPEPLSIFVEANAHIGPLFIEYIYDRFYE